MKDIDIIQQLLNGNHLEPTELDRARELVYSLNIALTNRGKGL